MTELVTRLDLETARTLTDEVKKDAAALWTKLLHLYEGEAHTALGYSSWADYCAEEFDWSDATAYRLLGAANVVAQLPMGSSTPVTERVARELVPVLRDDPEQVPEVWGEVVEEHGEQPTAAEVREVVERHVPLAPKRAVNSQHKLVSGIAQKARLIAELEHHVDLNAIQSLPEEEKAEWKQQLSAARTVLSRVIAAL